jgi:hypothetical protein
MDALNTAGAPRYNSYTPAGDPPSSEWDTLHKELCSALEYDSRCGVFRWRAPTPSPRVRPGSVAGRLGNLKWNGRQWSEARLVVFYYTKQFPVGPISRWDGVRSVSRFENLVYTLPGGRRFQGSKEITPHE